MTNLNEATDGIEVAGLSTMLEDDDVPPVLELRLRSAGRTFRATILTADDEWALRVRDEAGPTLPTGEFLFDSQAEAIVTALLAVVDAGIREPRL